MQLLEGNPALGDASLDALVLHLPTLIRLERLEKVAVHGDTMAQQVFDYPLFASLCLPSLQSFELSIQCPDTNVDYDFFQALQERSGFSLTTLKLLGWWEKDNLRSIYARSRQHFSSTTAPSQPESFVSTLQEPSSPSWFPYDSSAQVVIPTR